MTSVELVSVGHPPIRVGSPTGEDGAVESVVEVHIREEVVVVETKTEVEEVSFGLAVTTAEDGDRGEGVGIAAVGDGGERGRQRVEHRWSGHRGDERKGGDDPETGTGATEGGVGMTSSSSSPERAATQRRPSGVSLRPDSIVRTRSGSQSHSNSNSRSRSSVMEVLDMGESSVATSWTQADGEARPNADQVDLKADAADEGEVKTPEGGTKTVRMATSGDTIGRAGYEEGGGDVPRKEEVLVVQEEDLGEGWHPLRYDGEEQPREGEGEKGTREEDVTSTDALGSIHDGDQSLEMNEKGRGRSFGSSGRNTRHLRLEFKRPSPQPWDEIDPPPDNNHEVYSSDYYSTLNSKTWGTLQRSRRRPLIPHSTFYFGPPPPDSAYGTRPVGQLGVHHPREIVRIERDYAGGELIQFSPIFPLELEGRITPTQFHQTINDINEILISAHSIQHAFVDNLLAVVTLHLSSLLMTSHYTKEMRRLKRKIEEMNTQLYNPVGLHILWPQKVGFLFLEIEYY